MIAAWLNGLTCVAPFTVTDCAELYNTIKTELGKQSVVDVHITPKPDTVHVTIDSPAFKYRRDYAITTR